MFPKKWGKYLQFTKIYDEFTIKSEIRSTDNESN